MPDGTGTVSPEKPINFTTSETLHYGGEVKGIRLTTEGRKAKDVAAGLRNEKAKVNPGNAKKFFEAYKNKSDEAKFTKQNREDLILKFGAGKAKMESGAIKPPDAADVGELNLHNEAKTEIENINNFIQYSEITTEASDTGKTIAEVMSRRSSAKLEVPTNFNDQRGKALDYIINTEVIQKGLPDLAKIVNPEIKRKLIEQTLAADPVLKAKVLEKMNNIMAEAKTLPEPPVSKEVNDAKESKIEADKKKSDNLDLVKQELGQLGIDDAATNGLFNSKELDTLRATVETYAKDGKSVDQILVYLRSEAMSRLNQKYPDLSKVTNEYNSTKKTIEELKKTEHEYISGKADKKYIDQVQTELKAKEKIVEDLEEDPNFQKGAEDFNGIIRAFNNQKDNSTSIAEGGIYISPVAHEIDRIIKAQKDIINADKVIKEKGTLDTKAQEAWEASRLEAESNLISKMKDAVQSSIAEILDARYDEMVGLERAKMVRVAEEEGKKGEKAIENGIKSVEYVKEHRWIEHNPLTRKKEVHRHTLGSDIKYAAYAGEDGIKRLILRDSGLQTKDAAGNLVAIDWKNTNLDTLPDDVRKTLEGVYGKAKDSYEQKLFGDFFLGKNALDRTIFGRSNRDLALRQDEYELLESKFKDTFTQGINSKAEAKAALNNLKAMGIKTNGGLLAILALLLAAPFVAAKKAITG
jgi:hypothetical protein